MKLSQRHNSLPPLVSNSSISLLTQR